MPPPHPKGATHALPLRFVRRADVQDLLELDERLDLELRLVGGLPSVAGTGRTAPDAATEPALGPGDEDAHTAGRIALPAVAESAPCALD